MGIVLDLEKIRNAKAIEAALKVCNLASGGRYINTLPFNIDLIAESESRIREEIPNIINGFGELKPDFWNFYFSSSEARNYFSSKEGFSSDLGLDENGCLIPNPKAFNMRWILADFAKKGYLDTLETYMFRFSSEGNKVIDLYGSADRNIGWGGSKTTGDTFLEYLSLSRQIVNKGMEGSMRVLLPEIFDWEQGLPVLQHAFGNIKDEKGIYVVCHGSDVNDCLEDLSLTSASRYDGVMFSPGEFAEMEKDDMHLVWQQITELFRQAD